MWVRENDYNVSWSGVTIWEEDYSDSAYFDNEREAREFCEELKRREGIYFINCEHSIIWRREKGD